MSDEANMRRTGLLRGHRVELRTIEEDDLPLLRRWRSEPGMGGEFDPPRPASLADMRRRYLEKPAMSETGGELLIVTEDGVPVGTVQFHREWYGVASPAANVGIFVAPEHRGHGYGAEAQRLLADYLLAMYPIGRVEAGTDIENIAEQRALEKAGFTREGVARAASWRGDRWHDMVTYSRIRGDE
jgi:RimJ/RimL family protein N-acetyltransferase